MESDAFSTLFRRLLSRAQADPELADVLRELATLTLNTLTPQVDNSSTADSRVAGATKPQPQPDLASEADLTTFVEGFSNRLPAQVVPPSVQLGLSTVALPSVPGRMRLKAQACRWLAEHGYTTDGAALNEHRRLIAEAQATDCYLWMLDLTLVNPNLSKPFQVLADNFASTARTLDLWLTVVGQPKEAEIVRLAVQAQAALRESVSRVRRNPDGSLYLDEDQRALFDELKRYGAEHNLFLEGLALKDIVDPESVGERDAALDTLEAKLGAENDRAKVRLDGLKRLKYHAKKLQNKPSDPDHDWQVVADTVVSLHQAGMPESDAKLREALAPIARLLPIDTPHPLLLRIIGDLAELERAKAARQAEREAQVTENQPPEVKRAAELIAGRTLVMIGGRPNQDTIRQIETSLRCEVDWVSAKPHTSPETFKPNILQKEVILVLLLIRWSSHVFGEVDTMCRANGKHLVRVPRGYNVKTLATQILDQASERLGSGR